MEFLKVKEVFDSLEVKRICNLKKAGYILFFMFMSKEKIKGKTKNISRVQTHPIILSTLWILK